MNGQVSAEELAELLAEVYMIARGKVREELPSVTAQQAHEVGLSAVEAFSRVLAAKPAGKGV